MSVAMGRRLALKGKSPVNVGASVRARLLEVSKERREDFTLTLMNYAAEHACGASGSPWRRS